MSLYPQAVVNDLISECNGQPLGGNGPWTVFNVAGVTSGQVYDKITEANQYLQSMVAMGGSPASSLSALQIEQVKRFEVVYGSARLAMDLIGIQTTDGFNYNLGGLAVQRQGAQQQAYVKFIDDHLAVAKEYIKAFHQWFWVFSPDFPTGFKENGTPQDFWAVSSPRYT